MKMLRVSSAKVQEIPAWILMCLRETPHAPSLQVAWIPQHEPETAPSQGFSDYANPLWPSFPLTFSSGAIVFTKVSWYLLHPLINRCRYCALFSAQSTPKCQLCIRFYPHQWTSILEDYLGLSSFCHTLVFLAQVSLWFCLQYGQPNFCINLVSNKLLYTVRHWLKLNSKNLNYG